MQGSEENQLWLSITLILTNVILVCATLYFNDDSRRGRARARRAQPAGAAVENVPATVLQPAPQLVAQVAVQAGAPRHPVVAAGAEERRADGQAAPRVIGRSASGGFGRTAGVDNGGGGVARGAAVAPMDEPEEGDVRAGAAAIEERVQTLMAELAQKDEEIRILRSSAVESGEHAAAGVAMPTQPTHPFTQPLHEKRVDPSTHKPYWYNPATGQSSWDPPPGWAEPRSAAEPPGQSNGQNGQSWHGGNGTAVLASAGATQYGQAPQLDYSVDVHLADLGDT